MKLILEVKEVENGYVVTERCVHPSREPRVWVAKNPEKLGKVIEQAAVKELCTNVVDKVTNQNHRTL